MNQIILGNVNIKVWTAPQGLDTCVRIDGSLT
jgi:hypothetical protein